MLSQTFVQNPVSAQIDGSQHFAKWLGFQFVAATNGSLEFDETSDYQIFSKDLIWTRKKV
jgi:hypothetical protein